MVTDMIYINKNIAPNGAQRDMIELKHQRCDFMEEEANYISLRSIRVDSMDIDICLIINHI